MGQSATAAHDYVTSYCSDLQQLSAAFKEVGDSISYMASYLGQAKAEVPQPQHTSGWDRFVGEYVPLSGTFKSAQWRSDEAAAEARRVMTGMYRPNTANVDSQTPIIPLPSAANPSGPQTPDGPQPPGGPRNPGGSQSSGGSQQPGGTQQPGAQQPSGKDQNQQQQNQDSTTPSGLHAFSWAVRPVSPPLSRYSRPAVTTVVEPEIAAWRRVAVPVRLRAIPR